MQGEKGCYYENHFGSSESLYILIFSNIRFPTLKKKNNRDVGRTLKVFNDRKSVAHRNVGSCQSLGWWRQGALKIPQWRPPWTAPNSVDKNAVYPAECEFQINNKQFLLRMCTIKYNSSIYFSEIHIQMHSLYFIWQPHHSGQ